MTKDCSYGLMAASCEALNLGLEAGGSAKRRYTISNSIVFSLVQPTELEKP